MTKQVGQGTARNDAPQSTDWAEVVRPLGSGPGGATEVVLEPATQGDITSIAASLVAQPLLAANADRLGFSIFNVSTDGTLYVKASEALTPVSATFFTIKIPPGGYYEDPFHYVGDVFGVWVGGTTGSALVTEYGP